MVQRREEAQLEAERALERNSELTMAQIAIASLHALRGEWGTAGRRFSELLQRRDNDPLVHEAYALLVLLPTGLCDQASAHAQRSMELAPARANASYLRALCEMMRNG